MSEEKFTSDYFEKNYHIGEYYAYKNVVFRNEDSSGCSCGSKDECLKACFSHFIKQNLTDVKKISNHFTRSDGLWRDTITRCCCGQYQEDGITHGIVTHIETNISFIVGSVCFNKQFKDAEDVKTFWKEQCINCSKIVARRSDSRLNFCNEKCVRQYKEKQLKKRSLKVYLKCVECDIPKTDEYHQKFPLCWPCKKKEDENELFCYGF